MTATTLRGHAPGDLPAAELAAAVRGGRARPEAAVEEAIDAAQRTDERGLTALVTWHRKPKQAFAAAEHGGGATAARRKAARGASGGALAGVPAAVADDLADLGLPTTAGSRILAGYVSPYEATAVARLLDAGALVVGKTNVDEFGIGRSTATSAYGPTRHPLDEARYAGGASGGAAAAVAAGVVRFALGTDTAGDVRRPAALCGVVGLKPTYGRVSRSGVLSHAPSLAQVGIVGRTVDDVALALEVIGGRDPRDATSADLAVQSLRANAGPVEDGRPLKGLRVGRVRDLTAAGPLSDIDDGVLGLLDAALVSMRDLGAEVRDVRLSDLDLAVPSYRAIAAAEAATTLARYDGVRFGARATAAGVRALFERTRGEGFGPEAATALLLGTHLLTESGDDGALRRAQAARARVAQGLADALNDVDLIVTPATSASAPASDVRLTTADHDRDDALLVLANLAGLPAITIPIGTVGGLPMGAQLMATHFGEATLIRAAAALERLRAAEAGR